MSYISRSVVESALDTFLSQPAVLFGTTRSRLEWINFYLTKSDATSYQNMKYAFANAVIPTGFRILITESDGTTAYDSSKSDSANVFTNVGKIALRAGSTTDSAYVINENHNTRPEIMQALQSSDGYGSSLRYSKSVDDVLQYYVLRVGNAQGVPVGCVRGSIPN